MRKQLPFAASEWLDGLALSIRAQAEGPSTKDDSKHSGLSETLTEQRLAERELAANYEAQRLNLEKVAAALSAFSHLD